MERNMEDALPHNPLDRAAPAPPRPAIQELGPGAGHPAASRVALSVGSRLPAAGDPPPDLGAMEASGPRIRDVGGAGRVGVAAPGSPRGARPPTLGQPLPWLAPKELGSGHCAATRMGMSGGSCPGADGGSTDFSAAAASHPSPRCLGPEGERGIWVPRRYLPVCQVLVAATAQTGARMAGPVWRVSRLLSVPPPRPQDPFLLDLHLENGGGAG
ncbi:hypothetical protein P7K49_031952 [Saguinus oedipus]|uniref:Uncharacterized protein n=1 Tax=Saguinus oedipus TaxID=9490 RepID=A0ABQ9U0U4_SAGOE|nr:hypothetical protein P7K49_031952 [Saguinus oedipus]